jgi:hypothetical protein
MVASYVLSVILSAAKDLMAIASSVLVEMP